MALLAGYRFEETGNDDRVGQVGGEPNLPVMGTWGDTTGVLDQAASNSGGGILGTGSMGTLAGIRNLSIAIWVKAVSGFPILELWGDGTPIQIIFGDVGTSAAATATLYTDGGMDSVVVTGTAPDGNWRHYVLTFNNSTGEAKLYENGSLVDTQTNAAVVYTVDKSSINLNAPSGGEAAYDMLLIYDSVINSTTVADLYNAGAGYDPTAGAGSTVADAIDDLAATPGVESLTFTWTAPDDGGAAITKYTLYLNGVLHTDEVTSPHEVTGLTGGVESGPWTVTATNSEGESDPSNAVSETPAEPPPAAPTNLAADTITSSSILLTWDDNSDDETGFELLYRYAGVGDFGAFDSPAADAESYNVTSLEPATAYDFRLVAVGSGGNSDPCDLLNVSTLSDAAGGRARLLLGVG